MNKNLRPWKAGESGNPGGRKRKPMIDRALEEALTANDSEKAKRIAERLISSAANGSIAAAKLIAERVEGRPQKNAADANKESTAQMSKEDVQRRLVELLATPEVKELVVKALTPPESVN